MKILDGLQLAGFIKERQAQQVRSLSQGRAIYPKLAIVRTNPDPVVDSYMNLKQKYGEDIGIGVEVHSIEQAETLRLINELNADPGVHGIIVQIPLPNPEQTTEILNSVSVLKDVDGLAQDSTYVPATPMAIYWLLSGYNIELVGKKIVIVGNGRLVGAPLAKMWRGMGLEVEVVDKSTKDLRAKVLSAEILVTATGSPGLIKKDMVSDGTVVVDAGVATDSNGLIGDVEPEVRELPHIVITPLKGGVGPLTVCALFDNVIRSALNSKQPA